MAVSSAAPIDRRWRRIDCARRRLRLPRVVRPRFRLGSPLRTQRTRSRTSSRRRICSSTRCISSRPSRSCGHLHARSSRLLRPCLPAGSLHLPRSRSIAIAGGGFVVTALAGMFDAIWHTAFGLDETAWPFPHSMLGWAPSSPSSASSRAASRSRTRAQSAAERDRVRLAAHCLIGPTDPRSVPQQRQHCRARGDPTDYCACDRAAVPAHDPDLRGLRHLNSLFVPFAAAGARLGVQLLQRFDRRPLVLVGLRSLISSTATWVPCVVPGVIVAIAGRRITSWRWLGAAGFGFGLSAALVGVAISKGERLRIFDAFTAMLTS